MRGEKQTRTCPNCSANLVFDDPVPTEGLVYVDAGCSECGFSAYEEYAYTGLVERGL